MSAVKMATNPYHLNNVEELFQELQQKFPEIPEDDIRCLMQQNGNDRSKCIGALGSKSCMYLYEDCNKTKKSCGDDSWIPAFNDMQIPTTGAEINQRRSSEGREYILTSAKNCSDVTVHAPPHPSGIQQSKSEQHFTTVVEQFVEPGPVSAPVVAPHFLPFGTSVSGIPQYTQPEYRPSYQPQPIVSSPERLKGLYVNETPPPIPKRQPRISSANSVSSTRGLSTAAPDVYQIKTPLAVSGGKVVVSKPVYIGPVFHYPNPPTGLGSPQHPGPPLPTPSENRIPGYNSRFPGDMPSPGTIGGGFYPDGTPIGVHPHTSEAYIFIPQSPSMPRMQTIYNPPVVGHTSISSNITGTPTSPHHQSTHPGYMYHKNELLTQTVPNTGLFLPNPPLPSVNSPPPGEYPRPNSPASGSNGRNFRSGSDPEKYTEALLSHQRARYDKLVFDLSQQQKSAETLSQHVASLERTLVERRRARNRNTCVSNEDLQKMRDEKSRLQLDVQLLTREIDMFNSGNTPLGVVEENDESFYENLPTGRKLVPSNGKFPCNPPSVTKPQRQGPPVPPPRPPPPRQPPGAGQTEEEEGKNWSCTMCTFENHPALDKCEVCEMPRIPLDTR